MPLHDSPVAKSGPAVQPSRRAVAEVLDFVDAGQASGRHVTELTAAQNVPRSNLYYWRARKEQIDALPGVRDFFESAEGLEMLHRIYVAAQFVFVQTRGCGVDSVGEFLRLSHLDRFVAASHGSVYQYAQGMEQQIVSYGEQERERLGAQMAPKRIAVCEDETFHPQTCLVAIEPVSGYILVERYSESRDAAAWSAALDRATADLAVDVEAICSDEAKGLVAHAEKELGVQHATDLFHGQHELCKATARPLAQRLQAPRKALEAAKACTEHLRQKKDDYWNNPRPPGRPPLFDRYIAQAEEREQAALEALQAIEADRESVKQAIRLVGDAYHPVDLESGALQDGARVEERIRGAFAAIDDVAERAGLSETRREWIDKARRLIPKLRANIAFLHGQLDRALDTLDLTPAAHDAVRNHLVPGLYLRRAAARARTADEARTLRTLADQLLAAARQPGGPLMLLDSAAREHIEAVVSGCLDLFVRSSACVEGRNGQLALRHHSLHKLSPRRLEAMTVIHNFYIQRADDSSAAERFFNLPPEPLFEWLLDNQAPPPRPRASRQRRAA